MSAGGGTLASPPPVTTTQSSRRSKPPTENWDDDFEFSFPRATKAAAGGSSSSSSAARASVSTPKRDVGGLLGEGSRGNAAYMQQDSPDSFDEDWDDPLPGPPPPPLQQPPRSPSGLTATKPQRSPVQTLLQPPRSSQSHSPTLPSPTSAKPSPLLNHSYPATAPPAALDHASTLSLQTVRQGDTTPSGLSTPRGQLSKRSSSSFTPARQESPLFGHSASPAHRSSPNLANPNRGGTLQSLQQPRHQTSTSSLRRVPVPPIPPGLDHSRTPSPTKHRSQTKSPFQPAPGPALTSVQTITASPSTENLREKKPKFWKRFSAGPSTPSPQRDKDDARRRRSSSVGNLAPPNSVEPPVPPLPANLRSPSAASGWSSTSIMSSASSTRSGKGRRFSLMMRRSSSNISALADTPTKPPPMPHPYALRGPSTSSVNMANATSSSTVNLSSPQSAVRTSSSPIVNRSPQVAGSSTMHRMAVAGRTPSPAKPRTEADGSASSSRPRTFSPGFHLPSPSPGSPYNRITPTPSECDADADENDTSRRRRRVRPASAMPIPRKTAASLASAGYDHVNSSSPTLSMGSLASTQQSSPSQPRNVHMPTLAALSSASAANQQHQSPSGGPHSRMSSANMPDSASLASGFPAGTSPSNTSVSMSFGSSAQHHQTNGQSSAHQSTLKRITSFSKKHSRRLSGGWMFGTQSSTSSNESGSRDSRPPLQLLETVTGSPSKPSTVGKAAAASLSAAAGAGAGTGTGSDKAPFPHEGAVDLSSPRSSRNGDAVHPLEAQTDWEDTAKMRAIKRERRRMSFNDFVIPDQVLAKQKELKRGIGAVKKFAGGVEALKQLVAAHDRLCDGILASGSEADTRLFVQLENEYAQWWEMATVLIEVASTGTREAESPMSQSVRSRRITLATDDARVASEALRSISGSTATSFASTTNSFATSASLSTNPTLSLRQASYADSDVFTSPPSAANKPYPADFRASTGRGDLSQRQLDVLRTMLRTPVDSSDNVLASVQKSHASKAGRGSRASMPVPPTMERPIIPAAPSTMRASQSPLAFSTPAGPPPVPTTDSPDVSTYVMPSPSYPSPNTAAALAQPRHKSGIGLAGLRDFLRSLKNGRDKNEKPALAHTAAHPPANKLRKRPAPINTVAAEKYGQSPPASPIPPSAVDAVLVQTQRGNIPPHTHTNPDDSRSPIKVDAKKRRPGAGPPV
ncbi:uncharacterized protein EHS24_005637 [Apiotrichum porosum]|uniref:Uncharacterized protein n=1 Tax=Apiotrichum porosum TaxID=105984 RepID=A0A427XZ18_9TREE|nr:uncharacterized protein EHS24_005637 [Apiotrichum porosum]RSH84134.1 hypothetical protein EHS24_005637 [Apiotrichum porosum]